MRAPWDRHGISRRPYRLVAAVNFGHRFFAISADANLPPQVVDAIDKYVKI